MRIQHGRVSLELHDLAQRRGPTLLLLHALFGSSADWRDLPSAWPGPVYALDFCGHGCSDWLTAGGYTPELLAADADCALARIGDAALLCAGLGAYVAVLLAGARRDRIPAALLLPGPGLAGGGASPPFAKPDTTLGPFEAGERGSGAYDPMVSVLDRDVRPVDYVEPFARAAGRLFLLEDSAEQPPWWQAVRQAPNAEVFSDLDCALARLAAAAAERE
jgi:pimeloyl-ACP methyl ester carboxylesterase